MLTYQDVITIKLDLLTTAAGKWDEMAKKFDGLETLYKGSVQSVSDDGGWQGLSANAASGQFAATRGQFGAAQVEARAIASLLRDAHTQYVTLVQAVKDVVAEAKADKMSVDGHGKASYDLSQLAGARKDPDYDDYVSNRKAAETEWTRRIQSAVQAVDDADQGAKLALREAAGVGKGFSWLPNAQHSFNGKAVGDIEVIEAQQTKKYADRILDGENLSPEEMAEWKRSFRDNADNKEFSQTLLNSLGPEETLKLSNKFNDLAYFDDTKHKKDYLGLEQGLANTVAGATRVPEFKDSKGKKLLFGSNGYQAAFDEWSKSSDAEFYNEWRDGLKKAGVEKYDLDVAGEKIAIGKGHDQEVRGYQSLVTLMQQGDGYSPQFLADVTDDMIAAEKKDENIWDLYGEFSNQGKGDKDGWFANDPVDGALQIMSRDPEASTGYLDPGAGGKDAEHRGNDRLHYLLDERNWDLQNNTGWRGNIDYVADDTGEADARSGLAAAIQSGATGHPALPDGHDPMVGQSHNEGQARIMRDTIGLLGDGPSTSVPDNLRRPVADALAEYATDTHEILSGVSGEYIRGASDGGVWDGSNGNGVKMSVNTDELMHVMRGLSEDPEAYGSLHKAESTFISQELDKLPQGATGYDRSNPLDKSGAALGAFTAIREDVINDNRSSEYSDADWKAKAAYHIVGGAFTPIPGVGDVIQRGIDTWTWEWSNEMKGEADAKAQEDISDHYLEANNQMALMIHGWAEGRGQGDDKNLVEGLTGDTLNGYDRGRNTARGYLGNT
ncbi:hypothetical protein OG729_24305 [Streptomyces sp. NBC_00210]|uniref:hypothetical protein n=1 Tax=Streptomyces sp. NBC_00210 TaxID=2903636 RepID=UPI003253EFAD